jgi:pimeloyl-ACP methyl ester carboxylesterase
MALSWDSIAVSSVASALAYCKPDEMNRIVSSVKEGKPLTNIVSREWIASIIHHAHIAFDDTSRPAYHTAQSDVDAFRWTLGGEPLFAVRGTMGIEDLLVNLDVRQTAWSGAGGVHAGFHRQFESLASWADGMCAMHPGEAVRVVGHSLGGAVGTLLAAHLAGFRTVTLHTFGCPRVGDAAFARGFPELRESVRVSLKGDPVVRIPMSFRFTHVDRCFTVEFGPSATKILWRPRDSVWWRFLGFLSSTDLTRIAAEHDGARYVARCTQSNPAAPVDAPMT